MTLLECAVLGPAGSVPFGLLVSRLFGLGDVRKIGSGNIGATNVLRTGNRPAAALTLLLDGGKGTVAVILGISCGTRRRDDRGRSSIPRPCFPVWLGFKGGKGVATFFGVLLGAFWPVGLLAIATWLAVAALLRISSLSALVAAALAPAYALRSGNTMLRRWRLCWPA